MWRKIPKSSTSDMAYTVFDDKIYVLKFYVQLLHILDAWPSDSDCLTSLSVLRLPWNSTKKKCIFLRSDSFVGNNEQSANSDEIWVIGAWDILSVVTDYKTLNLHNFHQNFQYFEGQLGRNREWRWAQKIGSSERRTFTRCCERTIVEGNEMSSAEWICIEQH